MRRSPLELLLVFFGLGCRCFGGPIAHLAAFRREFVERRAWLDDERFAQCVALTQLLPGPASSQTGMTIGWLAGGPLGAVAAWVGFTLPSAAIMTSLAVLYPAATAGARIHGLLLAAAAIVASAIVAMRRNLAPDAMRLTIALAVLAAMLLVPGPATSPLAIAASAALGGLLLRRRTEAWNARAIDLGVGRRAAIAALGVFVLLLAGLWLGARSGDPFLRLGDVCFRVGALVFGGGHVVLPLLQTQLASTGIVDQRSVLAGYSAAQAMPGPLFTISSYVGARAFDGALGVSGSLVATVAIFLPSFFLLAGIAPFYRALASRAPFRAALAGANAGVIGLLAAALVTPIFSRAVRSPLDAAIVAVAFVALECCFAPAWAVVVAAGILGAFVPP